MHSYYCFLLSASLLLSSSYLDPSPRMLFQRLEWHALNYHSCTANWDCRRHYCSKPARIEKIVCFVSSYRLIVYTFTTTWMSTLHVFVLLQPLVSFYSLDPPFFLLFNLDHVTVLCQSQHCVLHDNPVVRLPVCHDRSTLYSTPYIVSNGKYFVPSIPPSFPLHVQAHSMYKIRTDPKK